MSAKRFEGKNLEEAIDSAARAFGVESFRVSYHVVLEKRGFLGGTKRVVIEAEVSGAAPSADEKKSRERGKPSDHAAKGDRPPRSDRPARSERPQAADRPAKSDRSPRQDGAAPGRAGKKRREEMAKIAEPSETHGPSDTWVLSEDHAEPESGAAKPEERGGRNGRRRGRRGRGGRGRQEGAAPRQSEQQAQPEPALSRAAASVVEVPEQGESSPEAVRVAEWCEAIFRSSELDLVARTTENDEEISVELFGADMEMIVDATDYLDSLQVLANKTFTGRSMDKPIELDAGGFKRRREEDLARRAREMADRVREEGRERSMRAMSPIERRIVHLALEEEQGVTTESRGRGFHKRVAILPSDSEEEQAGAGES